jgi:hypothetical protein
MRNAVIYGLIIGVLSAIWIFAMKAMGYSPQLEKVQPIEFVSILIPVVVIFFGIKSYRDNDLDGHMGFLEALIQTFKIMLVGGVLTTAASIVYIEEFSAEKNLMDFSGRIFGALLVGVLSSLGIALLLHTKSNKVD